MAPFVYETLDIDGNPVVQYIYTLGADLISQERNGKTYTYLYDGHGSVTALSDESGKITDTYSYDAFGNLLKSKGRTANNYRYCGEQFDSTTGLYYLRARYMDTNTGRFISQDSYAGSTYDPASLHKYLYANSNPVMYTDPSGYMVDFAFAGAINAELHKSDVIQSSAALATGMKIISSLMKSFAIVNHVYEQIEYLLNSIDDVASGDTTSLDVNRGGMVESFPLNDEPPVIIETFPLSDESDKPNIETFPLHYEDNWTESIPVETPEPYIESFPIPQENGIKIFYINNTAEATEKARSLGYYKTNYKSHGQAVYYNSKNKTYITLDKDSHNGGVWKMAKSPEDLQSKKTRMGTYDEDLNRIGD